MTWITWSALALGSVVAALLGLAAYGSSRWAEATRVLLTQLEAARGPPTFWRYNARQRESLPAPVGAGANVPNFGRFQNAEGFAAVLA